MAFSSAGSSTRLYSQTFRREYQDDSIKVGSYYHPKNYLAVQKNLLCLHKERNCNRSDSPSFKAKVEQSPIGKALGPMNLSSSRYTHVLFVNLSIEKNVYFSQHMSSLSNCQHFNWKKREMFTFLMMCCVVKSTLLWRKSASVSHLETTNTQRLLLWIRHQQWVLTLKVQIDIRWQSCSTPTLSAFPTQSSYLLYQLRETKVQPVVLCLLGMAKSVLCLLFPGFETF